MSSKRAATPEGGAHERTADLLQRSVGALSTAAMARMESELAWFSALSAEDRSWVGSVVQAGIRGFVGWYRTTGDPRSGDVFSAEFRAAVEVDVFGAAPRALTGVINLEQTVELVRLSIEVFEDSIDALIPADDAPAVHASILRYAREVAFATAHVHARAAEIRGAWDARLEALVIDTVLRSEPDESLLSRASAIGWEGRLGVCVVIGLLPGSRSADLFAEVRHSAQAAGMDALCATHGDRMVAVLGGVTDGDKAAAVIAHHFAEGPVVVGPVCDDLARAHTSARAALSAMRVAPSWPEVPRPVASGELLPERALAGDGHARRALVQEVYRPLADAKGLLETASAYLGCGGSIEASARALFVHPNTVRYRLNSVAELTGLTLTIPRHAFTCEIALVLGRLHDL